MVITVDEEYKKNKRYIHVKIEQPFTIHTLRSIELACKMVKFAPSGPIIGRIQLRFSPIHEAETM